MCWPLIFDWSQFYTCFMTLLCCCWLFVAVTICYRFLFSFNAPPTYIKLYFFDFFLLYYAIFTILFGDLFASSSLQLPFPFPLSNWWTQIIFFLFTHFLSFSFCSCWVCCFSKLNNIGSQRRRKNKKEKYVWILSAQNKIFAFKRGTEQLIQGERG